MQTQSIKRRDCSINLEKPGEESGFRLKNIQPQKQDYGNCTRYSTTTRG